MPASSKPADRRASGAAWEAVARAEAIRRGLRPVAANAGYRFGELDLVMREGDTLVFIEVRYRRSAGFGGAAASVDRRKMQRLAMAAQAFLAAHPPLARLPCRFDVAAITGSAEAPVIDWIRDAFRLDEM